MNQAGFNTNRSNKFSMKSTIVGNSAFKFSPVGQESSGVPLKDLYYHGKQMMPDEGMASYYFEKMAAKTSGGKTGFFHRQRDELNISPRGSHSPEPKHYNIAFNERSGGL